MVLFFAPELSTSNRATLGGMINTDASGQGSLQYGKTSDHVLALRSVLMNGEILDTSAVKSDDVFRKLPACRKWKKRYIKRFSNVAKRNAPQSFKIYHNSIAFSPVTILRMSLIKMKVNLISPEF